MDSDLQDSEAPKGAGQAEIPEEGSAQPGASPGPPVNGGDPVGPSSVPTPSGGAMRRPEPPRGFGKGVNDYLNHYVTIADAKAGAVLAANFAVGAALLDNRPDADPFWLYRAALFMLGLSSLICMVVVFPRLPSGGAGPIFWEDIRKRGSLSAYTIQVRSLDEDAVETEYASQNWWVSRLLHKKFRFVQLAIITFGLGVALSGWWALGS